MNALVRHVAGLHVAAPGKLVITGAYAVLEGAPALVLAVDRYAVACRETFNLASSYEASFALKQGEAPGVDVSSFWKEGCKLGLGSSAAGLVASLGLREAEGGIDLNRSDVRRRLFDVAKEAHARAQGGGSGVDVAASVYGGIICYVSHPPEPTTIFPVSLPAGTQISCFWSGKSVRTSDALSRLRIFQKEYAEKYRESMNPLLLASCEVMKATVAADAPRFVYSVQQFAEALDAFGQRTGIPIMPEAYRALGERAAFEGAAFYPSGAGGGDMCLYVGLQMPSLSLLQHIERAGLSTFDFEIDQKGVILIK
ncbi:mevalonate kinase [Pajaroellobacter abortibovis]|uniref:phosphomevalonate kinase n=1 Tax=Pajaroellobacter abortibovis TaxID=1882918 RepID=A0A1L6MV35_9BACT|nr:hypothetical protein [Pajaroellobacter abortibovis]APR99380.1 hypothetical protein BCY86_00815 [Pajaroellobacter abortibovis]